MPFENKPLKEAVALAVMRPGASNEVLVVLRPNDDDELPGLWGLPAVSLKQDESRDEAAHRVARQKLGATVALDGSVGRNTQERAAYTLTLTVLRAHLTGDEPRLPRPDRANSSATLYTRWKWASPEVLRKAANRGSLCSQIFLEQYQV